MYRERIGGMSRKVEEESSEEEIEEGNESVAGEHAGVGEDEDGEEEEAVEDEIENQSAVPGNATQGGGGDYGAVVAGEGEEVDGDKACANLVVARAAC